MPADSKMYESKSTILVRLLNYLQEQQVAFHQVYSQLPTLNDVFLEITGKELRD